MADGQDPSSGSPDGTRTAPPRGARALVFRVTDRLNRITRVYLGPAQVGAERRPTVVTPIEQQSAPCPSCGLSFSQHELVRSELGRQRLYCPRTAGPPSP